MPKAKIVAPEEGASLQALDLRTLGRPTHLLPLFARALSQELEDFFDRELNRRYHAGFRIAALRQHLPAQDELRWQWHQLGEWQLGSHIDRALLLGILDYRFGAPAAPEQAETALPAETETERRLRRNLAERLLPRLARAIHKLGHTAPGEQTPRTLPYAPVAAWQLEIELSDGDAPRGALRLRLDAAALDALLARLSSQRPAGVAPQAAGSFAELLKLKLSAALLEQTLPLGAILDLKPGSVLPVALQARADVSVRGKPLFTAQVAERQGKLCLSGFHAAE
ncbi:FliM/FliN family flagellar motor switch protein [Chromobacterium sp. IIBBL 290-4]|uniref:FliM/FliN family flagellar motor switch protein n=1 Tax=Chromobacterium sp. IIBBL 290-4 TaxID=2953890 RepID=UPI0020B87771|nr:FliM/FliN family flagellar motor switch protein [Chromobacterium sp. IIBBL 290-4]UTH73143.1 FliM/FliN family flagellar motor switch protein [Chromobacterium sp. IIBBL 290-4]